MQCRVAEAGRDLQQFADRFAVELPRPPKAQNAVAENASPAEFDQPLEYGKWNLLRDVPLERGGLVTRFAGSGSVSGAALSA
jgi:hypothetical protein